MEKFCLKCGTVASDTATNCPNCGAALGQPASRAYPQATPPPIAPPHAAQPPNPVSPQSYPPPPPQVSAVPPNYPPPSYATPNYPPSYPPPNAPPPQSNPPQGYPQALPPKKSNTALKWIVGILITLFLLCMIVFAAIFYIAHRVKNSLETAARDNGISTSETASPLKVSVCSLLSASEVGGAIGVPIVDTRSTADSCEYFAAGTPEDMTAKHMAALMKQRGADAQSQKMVEQFSGGIFDAQKNTDAGRQTAGNGTTPVLVVGIDPKQARFAMKLNKGLLGNTPGSQILGIGDEAFDAAGAMMMVRKGDRLIRITYTACPCGTDAIKPLAERLADQL